MPWTGWGIPVNIPTPPNAGVEPASWEKLKFSPLGLYDLRRRLGVLQDSRGIFHQYQSRFLAADLAWLVEGTHTDGNHSVPRERFHPAFQIAREGTTQTDRTQNKKKLLNLLFDIVSFTSYYMEMHGLPVDKATMLDRAYGGCTLIMHSEGTTQPNTPTLPEYLKAHVYFPPNIVEEYPETHECIARIVQLFVEEVGVRAVLRWKMAASSLSWRFTPTSNTPLPNPTNLPFIPQPTPATSSHYVFHGRPYGSLDTPSHPSSPGHLSSINNAPADSLQSISSISNISACDECDTLQGELDKARQHEEELQNEVEHLNMAVARLNTKLATATFQLADAGVIDIDGPRTLLTGPLPQHSPAKSRSASPQKQPKKVTSDPLGQVSGRFPASPATPLSPSVLRHRNVIRSFGPASAQFIADHALPQRLHTTLNSMCDEVAVEEWETALHKVEYLTGREEILPSLVQAMLSDAAIDDQGN
jgi:hypothetical protein